MIYQCKFCDCILASEYSLSNHQKTAKKCLIKQGIVALGSFECKVCKETFLCKSVLKKHTVSCSKKNSTRGTSVYRIVHSLPHNKKTFALALSDAGGARNDTCTRSWSIDNIKIITLEN